MVKQARARNRAAQRDGRAQLQLGDGRTIPFPDHSVDAAITVHTIYFMPDPAYTIAEIARVLRPGGRLVIACLVLDDGFATWKDPDVYRIPYAADVARMMRDTGFVNIDQHPVSSGHRRVHLFVADKPA
jgi:ubiquinone/menaquinone biosynthesis C-methylase UbiE